MGPIPLLFNALPASNSINIRFLARDPFEEDTRHSRVLFEEVIDDQSDEHNQTLPLNPDSARTREQRVRGGSRTHSMPHAPGGEAWTRVEKTPEELAILAEAASTKWINEYLSDCPPELEIPGFSEYLQSMYADRGMEITREPRGNGQIFDNERDSARHNDGLTNASSSTPGSATGGQATGARLNISNLFDGILPIDDSDDEGGVNDDRARSKGGLSPSPSSRTASVSMPEKPVSTKKKNHMLEHSDSPLALIEQVLEGTLDLGTALTGEATSDGDPSAAAAEVWAVREPIADLEKEWGKIKPRLAKKYPFELDTFQKEAIIHMERDNSVFIAAHTSAGKTVAAEYAFALSEKHCTRAVYTSPIKTISNQKFRDFSGQFEVGLLTGDVSIKPDSTCLIMTTEILRSMLYKGADIIRDIEWVIFDEVHYVNDAERGVVWEEVIIMLPDHIKLLLLSATVPNVLEFANWVGKTKQKRVYVTGTNKRPVPLEHSLYYGGNFYSVCSHEKYDPIGWKQAMEEYNKRNAAPRTRAEAKQQLPTGRGGPPKQNASVNQVVAQTRFRTPEMKLKSERSQWGNLIEKFKKKELLPMVAFCFSKKRCDALADSLQSQDLTSNREKSEIHVFCDKAFSRLSHGDQKLPQLLRIKEMLKRGLGVHHAGLLPIVKEVVEMLFCRGVIKVLFATETFAMGVNAPARAVVFQSTRKHDGKDFRNLLPGEYTQMAGRAGRRGLDSVGTVIIACWDTVLPEVDLKRMLTGSATKLESQFRLTYSMILNLLRVEDLKVEDMLRRSFAEFHAQRSAPEDKAAILLGQRSLEKLQEKPWTDTPALLTREEVEEYVDLSMNIERISALIQEDLLPSRGASAALVNGRIVLIGRKEASLTDVGVVIKSKDSKAGDCVVLKVVRPSPLDLLDLQDKGNLKGTANPSSGSGSAKPTTADAFAGMKPMGKNSDNLDDLFGGMKLKTLSKRSDDLEDMFGGKKLSKKHNKQPLISLPFHGEMGNVSYVIAGVDVRNIVAISKVKIDINADEVLRGHEGKISLAVQGVQQVDQASLELMDPISDLKVNRIDIVSLIRERQIYLERMIKFRGWEDPMMGEVVARVKSEKVLRGRVKEILARSGDEGLSRMPQFVQSLRVLEKLGYVRSDKSLTLKGAALCELGTPSSELIATELIFANVMSNLDAPMAAALLSALVFQDKTECDFLDDVPGELVEAYEKVSELALAAGEAQRAEGLDVDPAEFVRDNLNFGLLNVVYQWGCGLNFAAICSSTDVMEGACLIVWHAVLAETDRNLLACLLMQALS
jgi:antiviral helicase SKI2